MSHLDRRSFLLTAGALSAVAATSLPASIRAYAQAAPDGPIQARTITLCASALEPHIDTQTMQLPPAISTMRLT